MIAAKQYVIRRAPRKRAMNMCVSCGRCLVTISYGLFKLDYHIISRREGVGNWINSALSGTLDSYDRQHHISHVTLFSVLEIIIHLHTYTCTLASLCIHLCTKSWRHFDVLIYTILRLLWVQCAAFQVTVVATLTGHIPTLVAVLCDRTSMSPPYNHAFCCVSNYKFTYQWVNFML